MYNFEIRPTTKIGVIYILDFEMIYFQTITKLLRNNKIPFELVMGNDFFRIELLDKNISLSDVMALMEIAR